MSRVFLVVGLTVVLVAATMLSGCVNSDASAKANLVRHRGKLLLADEPDGAMGVIDAREAMPREGELVIVGKVGGRTNPWTEGQASFFFVDASVALVSDGKHKHEDGEDCAFCRKLAKQTEKRLIALVQFIGDDGAIVPIGAQELFDIGPSDTVVVRGRAKLKDDGWLVVTANGLYVRR